jgi:hypothetical protein
MEMAEMVETEDHLLHHNQILFISKPSKHAQEQSIEQEQEQDIELLEKSLLLVLVQFQMFSQ